MFKIGDFSRFSRVSVKALRYYDEIGLLKPARVDEFTGYRYYTSRQLTLLNRIVALKSLGLSLAEIARLTADNLPPGELRRLLEAKREDIAAQLRQGQERLTRLEDWILDISGEKVLAEYEVTIKSSPPIRVATLRRTIPTYYDEGPLWQEFCGANSDWLAGCSGEPAMAVYHDTEYREHDVDVELAVPMRADARVPDNITVRELPEVKQAATLTHRGPYEGIKDAYFALMKWVEENGYQCVGPDRAVYLKGPDKDGAVDPKDYVTEIQLPVAKV